MPHAEYDRASDTFIVTTTWNEKELIRSVPGARWDDRNKTWRTRATWAAQATALSGEFRVLTYDLRGMGESGLGPTPQPLEAYVDDLLASDGAWLCSSGRGIARITALDGKPLAEYPMVALEGVGALGRGELGVGVIDVVARAVHERLVARDVLLLVRRVLLAVDLEPARVGQRQLAADDRLHALGEAGIREGHGRIEAVAVDQSRRREAELLRLLGDRLGLDRTFEHGEAGKDSKRDERRGH